jgi:hypothetical protein
VSLPPAPPEEEMRLEFLPVAPLSSPDAGPQIPVHGLLWRDLLEGRYLVDALAEPLGREGLYMVGIYLREPLGAIVRAAILRAECALEQLAATPGNVERWRAAAVALLAEPYRVTHAP